MSMDNRLAEVARLLAQFNTGGIRDRVTALRDARQMLSRLSGEEKKQLAVAVAERAAPELVERIETTTGADLNDGQVSALLQMFRRMDREQVDELVAALQDPEQRADTVRELADDALDVAVGPEAVEPEGVGAPTSPPPPDEPPEPDEAPDPQEPPEPSAEAVAAYDVSGDPASKLPWVEPTADAEEPYTTTPDTGGPATAAAIGAAGASRAAGSGVDRGDDASEGAPSAASPTRETGGGTEDRGADMSADGRAPGSDATSVDDPDGGTPTATQETGADVPTEDAPRDDTRPHASSAEREDRNTSAGARTNGDAPRAAAPREVAASSSVVGRSEPPEHHVPRAQRAPRVVDGATAADAVATASTAMARLTGVRAAVDGASRVDGAVALAEAVPDGWERRRVAVLLAERGLVDAGEVDGLLATLERPMDQRWVRNALDHTAEHPATAGMAPEPR